MGLINLEGKRVLVTGGHGFLGKYVCDKLRMKGAMVLDPRKANYNLLDMVDTRDLFRDFVPDIVVHLAATVGGIGDNVARPANMLYDNAVMGLNVLEVAAANGVDKLVMIGTVCSYPKYAGLPMLEDDLWNGYPEDSNAPYGVAKRMIITGIDAYRKQYGLNGISLVLTNLYGPGDNFDEATSHAIPAIIRKIYSALQSKESIVHLWGTGKPTRDLVYVQDAAEAIVAATEKYNKPAPVNIASGLEISIADLATVIQVEMGYSGEIVWQREKPGGQPRRVLDNGRAIREFGWVSTTGIDEGIRNTVKWYIDNLS